MVFGRQRHVGVAQHLRHRVVGGDGLDEAQRRGHQPQQQEVARARGDVEHRMGAFDIDHQPHMVEAPDDPDAAARIPFEDQVRLAQPGGGEIEAGRWPFGQPGEAGKPHRVETPRVGQGE
ncbi:MAG: hypothetical protein JWP04_2217 [Belnapia sp.]|nr:hypothetical protein [Belnapia sp.]